MRKSILTLILILLAFVFTGCVLSTNGVTISPTPSEFQQPCNCPPFDILVPINLENGIKATILVKKGILCSDFKNINWFEYAEYEDQFKDKVNDLNNMYHQFGDKVTNQVFDYLEQFKKQNNLE